MSRGWDPWSTITDQPPNPVSIWSSPLKSQTSLLSLNRNTISPSSNETLVQKSAPAIQYARPSPKIKKNHLNSNILSRISSLSSPKSSWANWSSFRSWIPTSSQTSPASSNHGDGDDDDDWSSDPSFHQLDRVVII